MKLTSLQYRNTIICTQGISIFKKTVTTVHGIYKQLTKEQFNTINNLIEIDKALAIQYAIQLDKELHYENI